jgi:hypothetical protein
VAPPPAPPPAPVASLGAHFDAVSPSREPAAPEMRPAEGRMSPAEAADHRTLSDMFRILAGGGSSGGAAGAPTRGLPSGRDPAAALRPAAPIGRYGDEEPGLFRRL